jgi:F0F1-type ATP synthase assembly protein I
MQPQGDKNKRQNKRGSNLALAAIAGLAGLLTLVIVVGAVFIGLWLDNIYQTRPTMTIVLVIASIPVSVISMYVLVKVAVSRIKY